MDIRVGTWAWLDKAQLEADGVGNIRRVLTVTPRKVGVHPGEPPSPIPLYLETPSHIGVPRSYPSVTSGRHNLLLETTRGAVGSLPPFPTLAMTPRPEQAEAVQHVKSVFDSGAFGGIVRAPCGWGKTIFGCFLMKELGLPVLVVVHKEFLLNQWKERLEQVFPGISIGRAQQDVCDFQGRHVVIGMVQSLASKDYPLEFYRWPGLVVYDECFPAFESVLLADGTVKRISDVVVGDVVVNAAGRGIVQACGSRLVSLDSLRLVRLNTGHWHVVTEGHPFLTTRGWITAATLAVGDRLLTSDDCTAILSGDGTHAAEHLPALPEARFHTEGAAVLFEGMRSTGSCSSLPLVRRVPEEPCSSETLSFLFTLLSAELDEALEGRASRAAITGCKGVAQAASGNSRAGVDADGSGQSDGECGNTLSSISDVTAHRPQAACAGRKWAGLIRSAAMFIVGVRRGLGCRVRGADRGTETERATSADPLQGGCGISRTAMGDRSGRKLPFRFSGAGPRSEERSVSSGVRVESVTCIQPEDCAGIGLCTEGDSGLVRVHNLTVSGHPSYALASAVIVHNCHRVGAFEWAKVPPKFPAAFRLGLSATPRRKDGADNVFLWHLGPMLFAAKAETLPCKVRRVWTTFKVMQTPRFNPDLAPKTLLLRFVIKSERRNAQIIAQLIQAAQAGRKVLVLSERLQHLHDMDRLFKQSWPAGTPVPSTGYYVGGMSERELDISEECQVIFATSQMTAEGLDIPAIDTLFLTTPLSDIEQAAGRIRRPSEGKKEPVIVDFIDEQVPQFKRMAETRQKFYKRMGWAD